MKLFKRGKSWIELLLGDVFYLLEKHVRCVKKIIFETHFPGMDRSHLWRDYRRIVHPKFFKIKQKWELKNDF